MDLRMKYRDRISRAVMKAGGVRKVGVGNRVVAAVMSEILAIVKEAGKYEMRGVGVFTLQVLPPATRHNPRNGTKHQVPERWAVRFRAGKKFRGKGRP